MSENDKVYTNEFIEQMLQRIDFMNENECSINDLKNLLRTCYEAIVGMRIHMNEMEQTNNKFFILLKDVFELEFEIEQQDLTLEQINDYERYFL